MATDTSGLDEANEQEHTPEGSGLGGFAVGVIFGAFLGAGTPGGHSQPECSSSGPA